MKLQTTPTHTTLQLGNSSRERAALVIADAGDRASLVLLDPMTAPAPGTRFQHLGMTWEISHSRLQSNTFVAHPVDEAA